jgi:hypothetical protein
VVANVIAGCKSDVVGSNKHVNKSTSGEGIQKYTKSLGTEGDGGEGSMEEISINITHQMDCCISFSSTIMHCSSMNPEPCLLEAIAREIDGGQFPLS